jgi:hypothetical protein
MAAFRVHIERVIYSTENRVKYVLSLHPEGPESGPGTPWEQYTSDAGLCEALGALNVSEDQQQRVLSVPRNTSRETFPVDITEGVARKFGWPPTAE